ncbi:hypothetical protein [Frondihabitans peucedani]|uniref:Bacterial Pleckstrin homology domain-containing protein n=1 Tax=Frondihabitans peucedani TaxID=598626 RepID=A0ABP8E647_9MICO
MTAQDPAPVFTTEASSRVLLVSAVVLGAASAAVLVFWLVARPGVDFLVLLLGLVFALLSCLAPARVRVTAGPAGLVVESVPLGFALAQYGLDEIADARVEPVSLRSWVGWGFRFTAGGSGVILRGGPALVLELISGKTFTVTLPGADAEAALTALEDAADAARP